MLYTGAKYFLEVLGTKTKWKYSEQHWSLKAVSVMSYLQGGTRNLLPWGLCILFSWEMLTHCDRQFKALGVLQSCTHSPVGFPKEALPINRSVRVLT